MIERATYEHELSAAREIARMAWARIGKYYLGEYSITQKKDGPVTEADREANALILEELGRRFPDDGLLSEEEVSDPSRLERDRVWIVDPIDGTRDFIDKTGNFAIQIGLAVRGTDGFTSVVGVVYHATQGRLYSARLGGGAWVESTGTSPERLAVSSIEQIDDMTVVATRSHRTPLFLKLIERMSPRESITMGSLGLKIVWVAMGRADYYLNNARGMCREWDVCAPQIILEEAGGEMTDLHGESLRYNRSDTLLAHGILASNGCCHEILLHRILEAEREVKRGAKEE